MDIGTQTTIAILLILILEVAFIAAFGRWAALGGRGRVLFGLFVTFWFGALIAWPIFAGAYVITRRRRAAVVG